MNDADDPNIKKESRFMMWLYSQVVKSKSQLRILPKNVKITRFPEDLQSFTLSLVSAASCHIFYLLLSRKHSKLPHMEKHAYMLDDA
jgi:hypothetical protein